MSTYPKQLSWPSQKHNTCTAAVTPTPVKWLTKSSFQIYIQVQSNQKSETQKKNKMNEKWTQVSLLLLKNRYVRVSELIFEK